MKYKNFTVRFLSLLLISAALFAYNSVAAQRQRMVEENEKKISEVEAYNESMASMENQRMNSEGNYGTETDQAVYTDGNWEGIGMGFGGDIKVAVSVSDGRIISVEILEAKAEDAAYLKMAETLTLDIVDAQSTEIDTISGATYSSKGILDAVSDALSKAVIS